MHRSIGRYHGAVFTVCLTLMTGAAPLACAQATNAAAWDSAARLLKSPATPTGGYVRYNFPRRDITLRVGDVTVSPSLALGSWAGFSGEPSRATMMGDLVLLTSELKVVLSELARQNLAITAIHNHLSGESPTIVYVHFHGEGSATDLARRLDAALALTATPRPVTAAAPPPVTIDISSPSSRARWPARSYPWGRSGAFSPGRGLSRP